MIKKSASLSSISFGALGGLIAGLAITPLIMLAGVLAGFSEKAILFTLGMAFGADPDNAIMVGAGAHLLLSIIIGIIFGLITHKINKLRIISIKKGIIEGIVTGVIVFITVFLPLSLVVIPSVIVGIMREINLGITNQQITANLQQSLPIIQSAGAIGYIIFGIILGAIVSLLLGVRKSANKSRTEEEKKKN